MRFSVVIPLYNKEECIKKTLDSVLAQTINDFEIVVVDDGSNDNSAYIVQNFNNEKIRLIKQKNQGVSAARNTGISESQGQVVAFLDADDYWFPDFLATVERLFDEFPEASVACPNYQVAYDGRMVDPKWKSVDATKDSIVQDFYEMATGSFWVTHSSTTAVKRAALDRMDHWFAVGETCYEDFDFWIRLCSREKVAHSCNVCAVYNRAMPQNARQMHSTKVVYSAAYMKTLSELKQDSSLSVQQKKYINDIQDRRMVPYIFSLQCIGNKKDAKRELKLWIPGETYKKYKIGLLMLNKMPLMVIRMIQNYRYKIF